MTRINSAIPVKNLTDEHLLAEHREIKRLGLCLQKAIKSGSINRIPKEFVLGTGHVLFFLDKMQFTHKRYLELYEECHNRGYDVQNFSSAWDDVQLQYYNKYQPTEKERKLLIDRLTNKIIMSPKKTWRYNHEIISKKAAIELLKAVSPIRYNAI